MWTERYTCKECGGTELEWPTVAIYNDNSNAMCFVHAKFDESTANCTTCNKTVGVYKIERTRTTQHIDVSGKSKKPDSFGWGEFGDMEIFDIPTKGMNSVNLCQAISENIEEYFRKTVIPYKTNIQKSNDDLGIIIDYYDEKGEELLDTFTYWFDDFDA